MEIILGLLLLLAFYSILTLPGLGLLWLIVTLSKNVPPKWRTVILAIFISVAVAPAGYGHAGLLPAALVIFLDGSKYKTIAASSLLLVFVISWVVLFVRQRKRDAAARAI